MPIYETDRHESAQDAVFTTLAVLPNGDSYALQAPAGWRLMEVLRDYGLPIKAECGGACSCASCHIHIAGSGRAPLHAPEDEELDRLAELFDADDSSRLSCQILTGPQTDGLAVRLAADSMQEHSRRVGFTHVEINHRMAIQWRRSLALAPPAMQRVLGSPRARSLIQNRPATAPRRRD
ncbi:MAG: hypothetical protein ACPH14_08260 [Candidatus Puniceispirillaceae bacterium]